MNKLIKQVKENNEDFEFYPSTSEILKVVYTDIKKSHDRSFSILDIGAGNGNVFKLIEDQFPLPKDEYDNKPSIEKYAIEKSKILIDAMPSDVFIIGTDFHQQTLIDKKMDVIFCNPPYSEYDQWMKKIISEANCGLLYMVVPSRWKDNEELTRLIEKRESSFEVLGSFDFLDSEYRKARAKVDILKIQFTYESRWNSNIKTDPFDIWFDEFFDIKAEPNHVRDYAKNQTKREEIHEVVKGQNVIERLEELYTADMNKLLANYKSIEKLDPEIFQELEINLNGVKEGLKTKLSGLKDLYWKELFDNLDTITNKLTAKSRGKLLGKLTSHTTIDFNSQNAYAVVMWVIKNSNVYMDKQLKEVYEWMTYKENVKNYKSNKRLVEDGWRYSGRPENVSHYVLDYRLIFRCYNNFNSDSYGNYDYPNGLNNTTHENINDILTIANNLGFDIKETSFKCQWNAGKSVQFFTTDETLLMDVKAYRNGNIHCKMNQNFMKKFNIEAGRLNGWIKSPKEASEEMDIPFEEVVSMFNSNLQLTPKNVKLIA